MSNIQELEIKNIDHLGIVAGIVDSIGLVEIINEYCGKEPEEKISIYHRINIVGRWRHPNVF